MTLKRHKTKSIIILLAILLSLTTLRLVWLYYHAPPEQPIAEDGLLDLTDYNFKNNQSVTLDGEWTFFPDLLIDDTKPIHSSMNQTTRHISTNNDDNDSIQFGTYYMTILLNEETDLNDLFSINIPTTHTASKLFVNGHLQKKSGHVATKSDLHIGKGSPYTVSFAIEDNEIDIMLQMSNFDTTKGIGIDHFIEFGTEQSITKSNQFEIYS